MKLKKNVSVPSLKEVFKSFSVILIILSSFLLTATFFFKWLTIGTEVSKTLFYLVYILLFVMLLILFIGFIVACFYYAKTEYNRQKNTIQKAIYKMRGGRDKWQ